MDKKIISVLVFLFLLTPLSRAEQENEMLAAVRRQASEEHRKEEEIQMLRFELERLKLEVETRKTMAELGPVSSDVSLPSSRVNIELKNISISADGSTALLDIGGLRQSVRAGENAGPFKVKIINESGIVLVDDKGLEHRLEVHL